MGTFTLEGILISCPSRETCEKKQTCQGDCQPALHASAPVGYKCADCSMDSEPCPFCYAAWWHVRHPNVRFPSSRRLGLSEKG